MIRRSGRPYAVFFLVLLLPALCSLLLSCGRKGEPTLKSYEKPAAPSGLRAVVKESGITLSWDFPEKDAASIKGFRVFRATNGDFGQIARAGPEQRSFTDSGMQGISPLTYKIVTENLRGMISKVPVLLEIRESTLPAPPAGISFFVEYNTLVLSWKSAGEATGYTVYKRSSPEAPWSPQNPEPLKENSYRDVFDLNMAVFYTIHSVRGNGILYEGPASQEIRIDPADFVPSPPSNLQAVPSGEQVYLIWKEPPETWIQGYKIYRETDRKKGFTLIGETQIPSFTDKEKPTTKRHYRVTALGPVQESTPAEIRNIVYSR
ncbi:MAG: hypothetical protein ACOYVJ_06020 [Nitrospirota bacterium]